MELTEEEVMETLFELAKERSEKLGINITDVQMDDDYIFEKIKERRLR